MATRFLFGKVIGVAMSQTVFVRRSEMNVVVTVGDVLDAAADVLISTANPWLNMSGGANGAICERHPI